MDNNKLVHKAAGKLSALDPFEMDLPWRRNRTPYRIFLAEFLLVRTRADVVCARFEEVYDRFPSPNELAEASVETIREALHPFGLAKRSAMLHKAAEYIVDHNKGLIPSQREELLRIPGIGPYTADAILAFAFRTSTVPADVNVLRFLSRLTGLEMEHKTKGSKEITKLLPLLSRDIEGLEPEILLDFTRLICKPRRPLCPQCRLQNICHHCSLESYPKPL